MAEEKEKPLTREDVLRLIEENGGIADGLDLSGKVFEEVIDLQGLDLTGIILKEAILVGAHLEKAILAGAHLEGTPLSFSHLEGAILVGAHLEGAILRGAKLSPETRLEQADWGNFILGEEKPDWFHRAADTYRQLKMWYTKAGLYDIAGKFFYREMEAKRKALKWWPNPFPRAWSTFLSLICGYGENPLRVIGWAASVVLGLAVVYYLFGGLNLPYSLYYSAVSFTALGYGNWASPPIGWVQGFGALESFIGVFMIALFLITFVRKMTR